MGKGYVDIEVIRNVNWKLSLIINDTRVAGVEPAPNGGFLVQKWRVKVADILEALPKPEEGE
jgi:hypothetical protein